MNLSILVSQDRWQDFDQAWRDDMESEDLSDLLAALRLAGDKNRIARCVALAREHAKFLEGGGRPGDAARVLGAVLVAGGNPGELNDDLLRCAHAAWAEESWWNAYGELSGLAGENTGDVRAAWRAFSKLCEFQPGALVYHPGGWGAGEILGVRPDALQMDVRFGGGRQDTFPMSAAVEIFEPLPANDLRAHYFRDAEGTRKRAKKEPLEVLRMIIERHHGRATTVAIRNAMLQLGIEGSAWSAWWRKARKLAENSEWFQVSGSAQKAVIQLLLQPKDPAATLRRQLGFASDLAEVHARVRELFVGQDVDPALREAGLEVLVEAATDASEPLPERVAAWLLAREQRGETFEPLAEAFETLRNAPVPTDPSEPSELWRLLQALPSARDAERAYEALHALMGPAWLDEGAAHLQHAPPAMARLLVDALHAAGRDEELEGHYAALLARPLRAPALLVGLARLFERRELGDAFPTPVQRARALVQLASHLYLNRRGDATLARVHNRLVETLCLGERPLLRRLLEDVDTANLRSLQMLLQRGVDDVLDHMITDIALEQDRNFFSAQSGPFWAGETIWTTRAGLARRSAELRELREVKIPENQDAIGRAASFGDLSENAEWEAAIEEQRKLTARAMEMEEELRRADLLENAVIAEGTVSPGTRVHYRDLSTGEEQAIVVLGPWDDLPGETVVSYRAPLAAGLLGLHAGERTVLQLPSGEAALEVVTIEALPDLIISAS